MATAQYSDTFTGGSTVNGRPLNNGLGGGQSVTWSVIVGTGWDISGDQMRGGQLTGPAQLVTVASGTNADDQQTSVISNTALGSTNGGPCCRWSSGTGVGNGYYFYRNQTTNCEIGYFSNGSFTTLSGGGAAINDGETMLLAVTGQSASISVEGFVNGVSRRGPSTNPAVQHNSGAPAILTFSNITSSYSAWDDFLFESIGSAPSDMTPETRGCFPMLIRGATLNLSY